MQPQPAQPFQPGYPGYRPVPRAPREAWERPVRVEPVPGTPYGLVIYGSPAVTSGPAVGSLVCGIASLAVSTVVLCFGLVGATDGWGPWVAGAFGVLAGALGAGGVGLGVVGLRRIRRAASGADGAGRPVAGKGQAIAGLVCGAVGVALVVTSIGLSVLLAVV